VDIADKIAVVTGSTSGVGQGIAATLHEYGARVLVTSRRAEAVEATIRALSAKGGAERLAGVAADVRQPTGVEAIVEAAMAKWGKIDILVNNAGEPAHRPFALNDDEAWYNDFDLKVMAAVRLTRLVAPLMKKAGDGRIVNIVAHSGKVPRPNSSPTAIMRAGGLSLTKVLSKELAADGIRVNAVVLGFIRSGQWEREHANRSETSSLDTFYEQSAAASQIPLGHFGRPQDVGQLIAFLCSREGSYISGTAINCDGGSCDAL
jgi:NAD(P)-dependent dehydrogenase (short-subunit alcohol dehydrogenase family)